MAESFLLSVDLKTSSTQIGLDWKTVSFLNRVYIQVTPENYHVATSFLQKHCIESVIYCDVTSLKNLTDVVSLLDNGAAKAFVSYNQIKGIVDHGLEDLERLILALDHSLDVGDPVSAAKRIKDDLQAIAGSAAVGVKVHDANGWGLLHAMQTQSTSPEGYPDRFVVLDHAHDTWNHYLRAVKAGHVPIIPANALTVDSHGHPELIAAHRLITSAIRSDRTDGLFPTVVSDEHGVCLGLVYSNEKSVETALKLGRGVYYSRSRNGIWIKGAESGDIQELLSIGWDCDADALRFTVRQKGDGKNSDSKPVSNAYRLQGSVILKALPVSVLIPACPVLRKRCKLAKLHPLLVHTLPDYSQTQSC